MLDVVFFDKYFGDVTRGQTPIPAFPRFRLSTSHMSRNRTFYSQRHGIYVQEFLVRRPRLLSFRASYEGRSLKSLSESP